MKFVRSAGWVFSGLVFLVSAGYAVEVTDQLTIHPSGDKAGSKVSSRKSRSAVKKMAKPEVKEVQTQSAVIPEQDARRHAGSDARIQAESALLEKPLQDADALIKGGSPAEAYRLLEPLEFDRSGEVRFDYLLGIAALDSGKPDKATLAFERVLAVEPNFAGARLDMARAYYQLGDVSRARTEFEAVMGQNPPAGAKVTIQKYLDAIAALNAARQARVTGYVEGVLGGDSNVNTGTSSSISVSSLSAGLAALITGLTGDPNPQIPPSRRADNYYGLNAGGEISRSLGENWLVYAGADARQRGNLVQTPYDLTSAAGRVGAIYFHAQNTYKLTLNTGQTYMANSMRLDTQGANAEWQHTFSPVNQMNAFVQYGKNRAVGSPPTVPGSDARTTGNVDQLIVGAGWLHVIENGKRAVFASVHTGKELDAVPVNVIQPPDGKKRFVGVRAGAQAAVSDQADGFVSLGWQHAVFAKPNAFIANNAARNEQQYDVTAGAVWHLDKLWSVKPQISIYTKRSNLAIYSYDRTDVSLTLRRDFK